MPTFNEVIFNVKNLYEGGLGSDDDNVSNEQVIFDINYYRAKLIREDLMKGRTISPYLIQEIACLDMETVDKAECCDITTDCYILKSVKPLPKTIEVYDKILIIAILSADREISFPLSTEAQLRWGKYNKYTKKA